MAFLETARKIYEVENIMQNSIVLLPLLTVVCFASEISEKCHQFLEVLGRMGPY